MAMYSILTPSTLSMFPQRDLLIGDLRTGPHSRGNYHLPQNVSPFLNPAPSSTTLPRSPTRQSKSMQNLSLSVVSLLFNKNSGQSRPGTASSIKDENSINLFGDPSSRDENLSPPPSRSEKRRHHRTRSSSTGIDNSAKTLPPPLNLSSISRSSSPSAQPQPPFRGKANYHHFSNPSQSMLYDDGRRRISPIPVLEITTDTDAVYDVEDACSAVSSIYFADDPDEKPLKKSNKSVSPDDDEPITPPIFNYMFGPVLDISAANRITEAEESKAEDDEDDFPTYRKSSLGNDEKLLRTLGELPSSRHKRRSSSIVFRPPPSCRSSVCTSIESPSDISWALPEVPSLSPLSTAFSPLSSPPPPSQSNEYEPPKRKHRSSAFRSVDLLPTFLKSTGHNHPRNSLFRSSSVSYSTVLASSAPVPQPQDPSIPPGLDVMGSSTAKLKERKEHRESVITQDSSLSDLHRLPASLTNPVVLEDPYSTHSLTFNYTPSRSHLVQRSSTITGPLNSHFDEHRDSFSTQMSSLSDLHRLPDSLKDPMRDEARTLKSANPTAFLGPSASASLPTPASAPAQEVPILIIASPSPRRHRPLPLLPIETSTLSPSQLPTKAQEQEGTLGTGTGAEEIIEPGSHSLVSPILFAPPASDQEPDDMESPFRLITGSAVGTKEKDLDLSSLYSLSPSPSPAPSLSPNSPRRAEVRPAFGDLVWGGVTVSSKPQPQRRPVANSLDHLDTDLIRSKDRLYPSPAFDATSATLRRPRTISALEERRPPQRHTVFRTLRRSKRNGPRTWVGEWNVDMPDVIKQLRVLK
ncbi:hypothetical protein F5887DRAFT_1074213 [Amanita rubescens]|nr:hypothetical protein F5887DRAFT_1074213 [Amanita rubescens]